MKSKVCVAALIGSLAGAVVTAAEAQPGQPTNVRAVANVDNTVLTVTWTPPASGSSITANQLDFRMLPAETVVASLTVGAQSMAALAIPPGTQGTFSVTVTAIAGSATGPPSVPAQFTLSASGCVPAAPTLTEIHNGPSVTLSWTASPRATTYVLEAGSASGGTELFNSEVGLRTSLATQLPVGFSAFVRVRARGPCGDSAPSNEVRIGGAAQCGHGSGLMWDGVTSQGRDVGFRQDTQGRVDRQNFLESFYFSGIARSADPACPAAYFGVNWHRSTGAPAIVRVAPNELIGPPIGFSLTHTEGTATWRVTVTADVDFVRRPGDFVEQAGSGANGTATFSARQVHGGVLVCNLTGQATFTVCRQ